MPNKIVVTGGAGCIGSDLCAALLEQGDAVVAIDNFSSGREEHLEGLRDDPRFSIIAGDVLDSRVLDEAFVDASAVFHLAANPDVRMPTGQLTSVDFDQNTLATFRVLEAMHRHRVRRLVFASTSAVYGIPSELPVPESYAGKPISMYGATKLSAEAMISATQHLFAFDAWIFRFANIVSAKTRKRGRTVIGDFIAKLQADPSQLEVLGDGKQAKSYLTSEDCIAAMLFAVARTGPGLHTLNLGPSDAASVMDIARMVIDEMGLTDVAINFTGGEGGWPGDVPRVTLDVRAMANLGWQASRSSREAVLTAVREQVASLV